MAALLLSEEDIYERTRFWGDFMKYYCETNEQNEMSFKNIESGESEKSESENNETSDKNELALVKVSQVPFEEREENETETENIQQLFSVTLPEIIERRKKWVELGMDRVLDTFDTKKINENLEIYLRNSDLVKYKRAGCKPKRKDHPRQVRFINEKYCSSDESLESVDTAKYILSNRKHKKHTSSTMTFKTFRSIKSYQTETERYQSTKKLRYHNIIERRFQSNNTQYFENDKCVQEKKKCPLTLRERKTLKKRIKPKRPKIDDSTFSDDSSTDSDAALERRQIAKWKYCSIKPNEKASGAKANLTSPRAILQWTSGCSADSESSFESKEGAICSRLKGCQKSSSSNSKFQANSKYKISGRNKYDSSNGYDKIRHEEINDHSRRALSRNRNSEDKNTIGLNNKTDRKLSKISDVDSAQEEEILKVSANNCQGDQKNLLDLWQTLVTKNADHEKPSSSIVDVVTYSADTEVITIISSDENASEKEVSKFSKRIETEVELKTAGKSNSFNKKALVILDSLSEKQLEDTKKYSDHKGNAVPQKEIAENPESAQKGKNPKPEKNKKQISGNDDISKNGKEQRNHLKRVTSLNCAGSEKKAFVEKEDKEKLHIERENLKQKLNNEEKTNSFNKKAIIVLDSLCAKQLESTDKYDEQEKNTVFQNANTENSKSKKDGYVKFKRRNNRIYSTEITAVEETIERSPLKNVAPSSKKSAEKTNHKLMTNCVFSDSESEEVAKPTNTSAPAGMMKSLLKKQNSLQAKHNNMEVKKCKSKGKKQQSKVMSPIKETDSLMTTSSSSDLPTIDCNNMNEQKLHTKTGKMLNLTDSTKKKEKLKVSNIKCQSNQNLNNEKKTNSFNKKAIIVSDSLSAKQFEDTDKYDEQEKNTVFQNASTEKSKSKKDEYVKLKRRNNRICSTSEVEEAIKRVPLKNVATSSNKSPKKLPDDKKNHKSITISVFSDSESEEVAKPTNTSASAGMMKSLLKNQSSLQAKHNNMEEKKCKSKGKKQQSKVMSPIKETDSLMTTSSALDLPTIDCNNMNEQTVASSILRVEKSAEDTISNDLEKSIPRKVLLHIPQKTTNPDEIFSLTDEHLKSAIGSRIAEKFLKYNQNLVKRTFKASSTVYFQFTNDMHILEETSDSEEDILEKFHKYGTVQESL